MNRRWLFVLALLPMATVARAQPVEVPETWGGDWESRQRLTGDWGGVRDELGKKGIVFDLDLLLTPQAVLDGGRSSDADAWGNVDYTLNIDTQKAGLWPGGFLRVEGDTGFGNNVISNSGALVPINTAALYPGLNERTTALTNLSVTQFLSEHLGVTLGKFNLIDSGETEFYGNYRTQFLNAGLIFPTVLEQVPLSAWGAGVIAIPTKDVTFSALALNPNGTPTNNPVFGDSVAVLGSGQLTIRPFGLVGHQSVSFSWNDKPRYSLEQDPSNIGRLLLTSQFPRLADPGPELSAILQRYFPGLLVPTVPPNRKSSSWAFSYGFDQYFWQPTTKENEGIGVFFAFGISDGNPNPVRYSFLVGAGGKGVIPGRPADTFGVGFASTQFSSAFVPFLRDRLSLGLEHENALEMYYNLALGGWLTLTADFQLVNPALEKALEGTQLMTVSTAAIAGVRLRARF